MAFRKSPHPEEPAQRASRRTIADAPLGQAQAGFRGRDLGRPRALRVTFIGDLSRIGRWGHLGGYVREVRAVKLIDVSATAHACV